MSIPVTRPGRRRHCAFTLIELLAALAVLVILLSTGLPGIRQLSGDSRLSAAVNAMAAHLHLARSEAILGGIPTVLCPSLNGDTCEPGGDWAPGLILFADRDRDRHHDPDERLLRYYRFDHRYLNIRSSAGRRSLRFLPSGLAPGSNTTITFCSRQAGIRPRALIVSNSGRPRLTRVRADGAPLRCD